jgi:hypothetical protein
MNHLLCVLHDALLRCVQECSPDMPQVIYNQADNALQTVAPYIVRTLPPSSNRDVLQLRRETASQIRDIERRIGVAVEQELVRRELTKLADSLEYSLPPLTFPPYYPIEPPKNLSSYSAGCGTPANDSGT